MKRQMNAVIVEIRGRRAAVLREDGVFQRVANEGYEIGQQMLLETPPQAAPATRRRARLTAYAGMVAGLLLLVLGGFKGYTMPVGVVSLDVNPSIEFTINCFDSVLEVSAVNDDAGLILAGMDQNALRYRSVDEAVDATILALRASGYLSETTENDVVISASSFDSRHTERIAERLGTRVGGQDDLTVYSVAVSGAEVQSAHARGTSAGKLYLVEELEDSWSAPEGFDADDWIERPVRDIIHETKTQREGKDDDDDDEETIYSTGMPSSTTASQNGADSGESRPSKSPAQEQGGSDSSHKGENKEDSHEP